MEKFISTGWVKKATVDSFILCQESKKLLLIGNMPRLGQVKYQCLYEVNAMSY